MARQPRKPLLPKLLWAPRKRTLRRAARVGVVRVPASPMIRSQTIEDFAVAAVLGVSLTVIMLR